MILQLWAIYSNSLQHVLTGSHPTILQPFKRLQYFFLVLIQHNPIRIASTLMFTRCPTICIHHKPIRAPLYPSESSSESIRHRKNPKVRKKHFSENFDKRPRILAFQITRATDPGTFALIRRKVASRLF